MQQYSESMPHGRSTLFLMGSSAIIISAAIILYVDQLDPVNLFVGPVTNKFVLAAVTLMPYMISAAVAAVTSVAIVRIIPLMRFGKDLEQIKWRMREIAYGDLNSLIKCDSSNPQIQELVHEVNLATAELSKRIAAMKIINRQQWEILEVIRHESVKTASAQLIENIEQIQANWEKMAELEEQFMT